MDSLQAAGRATVSASSGAVPPPPPPPPDRSGPPAQSGSSTGDSSRRKKRPHASCEGCRQRKQKCSRETVCTNCRLRNTPCVYIDAAPTACSADNPTVQEQLAEAREEIRRLQGQIDRLTQENAYRDSSEPSSSASDDPPFNHQAPHLPSLFRPRAARVPIPSCPLGPGNPYIYSYPNTPYEHIQYDSPSCLSSLDPTPVAQPTSLPVASASQSNFTHWQRQALYPSWPTSHVRHQTYPPSHPYELAHLVPAHPQAFQSRQSSSPLYQPYTSDSTEASAFAGPSTVTLPYYASNIAQAPAQNFTTLEQAILLPPQPRATHLQAAESTPTPTASALRPVATALLGDFNGGAEQWTGQVPMYGRGQESSGLGGGPWAAPRVKEEPGD